jgi:hypothetical protein
MPIKIPRKPKLDRMRREGFDVSVNTPLDGGRILHAVGIKDAADKLTDLATLSKYSQIAIRATWSLLTFFIGVAQLLERPQVIIGFHHTGFPLLLGLKALEGHLTILGQTRTGKTQLVALIIYQLCRLGFTVIIIGCKALDNLLLASAKAGVESKTRLNASGELTGGILEFSTLQPGIPTMSFNPFAQKVSRYTQPIIEAGNLVRAVTAGNPASNPLVRYYAGAGVEMIVKVPRSSSAKELIDNIDKLKLNKDEQYRIAGVRTEIKLMSHFQQMNLPISDPSSIDLARAVREQRAVYIDCNAQDTGTLATPVAGMTLQAVIAAQRAESPSRAQRTFVVVDEAQVMPREALKIQVEQSASAGISLILLYHTLAQMGEEAETISMTQAKIILGAEAGGVTDRYLQNLFGTQIVGRRSLNLSTSKNATYSFSESAGPAGLSITNGITAAEAKMIGFAIAETEEQVWKINETLALNDDREQFVYIVSPGAELSHWGGAIVGIRDGMHLTFDEINRVAEDTLRNLPNTYIANAKPSPRAPAPTMSTTSAPTEHPARVQWLQIFAKTIDKLRQERH